MRSKQTVRTYKADIAVELTGKPKYLDIKAIYNAPHILSKAEHLAICDKLVVDELDKKRIPMRRYVDYVMKVQEVDRVGVK